MENSNPPFRISVHQALGGGAAADLLLWRRWRGGAILLVSSTFLWFLFERAGYNLLSLMSNAMLLFVAILFFWAKSASILNRPLPPLPDLEISDESLAIISDFVQEWVNYALVLAHEITIGRNLKLFIQVASGLCVISYLGSLFNFFTLVYIGVILALSVPFWYDKYQDHINLRLLVAHEITQTQLKKIEQIILKKIPAKKGKKIE